MFTLTVSFILFISIDLLIMGSPTRDIYILDLSTNSYIMVYITFL